MKKIGHEVSPICHTQWEGVTNNRRDRKQPGWGQKLWLLMNISMIGTYHIYLYYIYFCCYYITMIVIDFYYYITTITLILKKKTLSMIIPLKSIGFWGVKMVKSSMIFHWRISPPFFSVNCTINLIEAIWRWFPLLNIIPVRSQWGRYTWPGFLLMTNHHMGLSDNRLIPSILPL